MAPLPILDSLFLNYPDHDVDSLKRDVQPTPAVFETQELATRTINSFKTTPSPNFTPGSGSRSPDSFSGAGFLALFAILGASMVLASVWFFFWAKNGGFVFRQGDWEDYKSTVLRRKGPDGKTLSNATKSTKLGGSTIAGTQHYKWAKQAARSVVSRDEKGRKGILAKRGWGNTHSITYSDDYMTESFATQTVSDEMAEVPHSPGPEPSHHANRYRDRDVQEYKRERPARVGGINRAAEGSTYATTNTEGSEVYSESSEQPLRPKPKDKDRERAERKAREEAAKMERRWKKEAEEAAAALAQESAVRASSPPRKTTTTPSRYAPVSKKQRDPSTSSRREPSYHIPGAVPSDVQSTVYSGTSGTSGQRSASYYDAYRPRASENIAYTPVPETAHHGAGRTRQASPKKSKGRAAGYRRGADSELD